MSSIYDYDGKVLWSSLRVENDHRVTGCRQTKGWAPDRNVCFALETSKPFRAYGIVNEAEEAYQGFGKNRQPQLAGWPEAFGRKLRAHFDFSTTAGEDVVVKVAISAVSVEGASSNLEAEVPGWDFDAVRRAAKDAWSAELSRVEVEGGAPAERRAFYAALSMLAPVTYMDVDGRYRAPLADDPPAET